MAAMYAAVLSVPSLVAAGAVLVVIVLYLLLRVRFVTFEEQLLVCTVAGKVQVHNGPAWVFLPPVFQRVTLRTPIVLGPLDYCIVRDGFTCNKRVEAGPQRLFLGLYEELEVARATGSVLGATDYIRFRDRATGVVRMEKGEQGRVFPTVEEEIMDGGVRSAVNLSAAEYVTLTDVRTGAVRVATGEALVFPGLFETCGKKKTAIKVDTENAVLVRNTRTGLMRLVSTPQMFFPDGYDEIVEERPLIKLAEFEAAVVRGKDGQDRYHFGNTEERSFFVPPHSELVQLLWSRGRRREHRDLRITKIDLRPMYMSFEFNCRTADNVELILEGALFWQVVDVKMMMKTTADTSADLTNFTRSKFIARVSKVTLQDFMKTFGDIATAVQSGDDGFFKTRGVIVHTLEVSGYRCAQASTATILEQIIQETTNRTNRLQQQESENEWQLLQIKGDIDEERAKLELLEMRQRTATAEATIDGSTEAERVAAFMQGTAAVVPDRQERLDVWRTLRKTDALRAVASNNTRLFFTPAEADLSIQHHEHAGELLAPSA